MHRPVRAWQITTVPSETEPGSAKRKEGVNPMDARIVDKSKLPPYLVPREGVKYFEDYNEEMYNMRNAAVKLVTEALGSR